VEAQASTWHFRFWSAPFSLKTLRKYNRIKGIRD
jgi:hypothetical protein